MKQLDYESKPREPQESHGFLDLAIASGIVALWMVALMCLVFITIL